MRKIARSIILHDDKLLLIKRRKQGKNYYTLPGGGIDEGETAEMAAEREVREETSIKSKVIRRVYEESSEFGFTSYFLSEYLSGKPKLTYSSVEAKSMRKDSSNIWKPVWVDLSSVRDMYLVPSNIRDQLMHDIEKGFPDEILSIEHITLEL